MHIENFHVKSDLRVLCFIFFFPNSLLTLETIPFTVTCKSHLNIWHTSTFRCIPTFYFECKRSVINWFGFGFGFWFRIWAIKMNFKHKHNIWLELRQTNKQWKERCGKNRGVDGKLNVIWLNKKLLSIFNGCCCSSPVCLWVYVCVCVFRVLVIFFFVSRVCIWFFFTWCVLWHFHVDKWCTYFLQGSTQMPQHFSMPLKFFSASRISALIWSMPSSTRSNCSVCSAHNQHQHSKSCRIEGNAVAAASAASATETAKRQREKKNKREKWWITVIYAKC